MTSAPSNGVVGVTMMDVSSLRQEIVDIQSESGSERGSQEDHHEKLFDVFRQIEAEIAKSKSLGDADEKVTSLIEAQTVLIRTAAALPARSMRDLLYKLAIWRWDAPDLEQPVETMNRADAIAYSAFLDLSKMLGASEVLKDFDKTNQR